MKKTDKYHYHSTNQNILYGDRKRQLMSLRF